MDVERQRKNRPSRMIACAEPLSSGNRPTHNTRLRDGVLLAATGHTPSDAGAEDPAPAPAHERKILTASCSRRPRAVATGGALELRGRAVLLRGRSLQITVLLPLFSARIAALLAFLPDDHAVLGC
jgi:hypothetical protein